MALSSMIFPRRWRQGSDLHPNSPEGLTARSLPYGRDVMSAPELPEVLSRRLPGWIVVSSWSWVARSPRRPSCPASRSEKEESRCMD